MTTPRRPGAVLTSNSAYPAVRARLAKVPQITVLFWIIKVLTTDAASGGLAVYGLAMAAALAVAVVSGVRGLRAARLDHRSACAG